jgi:hypothetical protein
MEGKERKRKKKNRQFSRQAFAQKLVREKELWRRRE